jgi:ABC-type bacteriocin/lantibiotic exporter with double-glycine peptidase domain
MKKTMHRIWELIRPYFSAEILGLALTIVNTAAVFAAPIVSKYLIDEVLPAHSQEKLYYGLGLFLITCLAQPLAGYLKDLIFLSISENITYDIRKNLFARIIEAPLHFFDATPKGEIISRIINDGRSSSEFVSHLLIIVVKDFLLVIMVLGGMFYLSVPITAAVLLLLGIFIFVNSRLSRKFTALSAQTQQNFDSICKNVNQMLDGIITIKAFLLGDTVKMNFEHTLHNAFVCNKKVGSLGIFINNLTGSITVLALGVIYGLGMWLVISGKTTLGAVMALGIYFQLLTQPVLELQNNQIAYQKMLPIFTRLNEYLELKAEQTGVNQAEPVQGKIVAKNLSFAYHNAEETLHDINLVIPARGLIGLVGRSGSGKSTFVKLLLGFYLPTAGTITIGEKNILEIGVGDLRNSISFVPQEIDLFNCSIKENISCGRPEITAERIVALCKQLGLHEKISALPEGYDSIISERVNLSGGEKQRIGIARALIKNAPVVIFDEPTAALDPENEAIIRNILEELSRERTVIVVAHKSTTIAKAQQIVVFDQGRIVKDGVKRAISAEELCS